MKQLSWKLVLPLTIISFVVFTKWWHVDVSGDFDEILTGFPLPFMCPGWHTSLSLQVFIVPLIIDILVYFTFWFLFLFAINKFIKELNPSKILTVILLSVAGFFLTVMVLIVCLPDNIYKADRNFEIEVLDSGYKTLWQTKKRPQ